MSGCQLKASRRMLLNSRVFAHDSSVPASHISNNCLISRNISCLTWSHICLPPPPPNAFHFVSSCLSNLPPAYHHVPVQKMHRQLCIISHAVQHNPRSALFSALLIFLTICRLFFIFISFPSLLVSFLFHVILLFLSTVSLFCFCNIFICRSQ